ncbi:uncharacterized protein LOC103471754 [Poecilia reticulata]|uniref:uncharacterized protein LOC103471754 n=1 Tax=Poecilia reticulata TaxID=8081 RepID=UPI0004A38763|nr:PREDICTED: uncharacterized protein LOC103471754 [Poecilia reticulata]
MGRLLMRLPIEACCDDLSIPRQESTPLIKLIWFTCMLLLRWSTIRLMSSTCSPAVIVSSQAGRRSVHPWVCHLSLPLCYLDPSSPTTQRGLESDITEIIQMPPSSPVYPETRKTLQCSVLSDSEGKPCPADNRVYWFKAGSDHSHPSLLYLQKNSGEECESASPEAQTAQRCFYNFSESSDAGTYHCAVAACGQILFGNGAELHYEHYEATTTCPSLVNIVFGFGLAISLIVLAVLIYAIKESNGNVSAAQQAKQVLCTKWPANIYSAVVFTVVTDDSGKKKANTETKKIYAAVI